MAKEWKSSVLRCCGCDSDCDICRFIEGEYDGRILYKVVELLDETLAARERMYDRLIETFVRDGWGEDDEAPGN